jgi:hypothetical protein
MLYAASKRRCNTNRLIRTAGWLNFYSIIVTLYGAGASNANHMAKIRLENHHEISSAVASKSPFLPFSW